MTAQPLSPILVHYNAARVLVRLEVGPRTVFGLHSVQIALDYDVATMRHRILCRAQTRPGEAIEGFAPIDVNGTMQDVHVELEHLVASFIAAETHARRVCC